MNSPRRSVRATAAATCVLVALVGCGDDSPRAAAPVERSAWAASVDAECADLAAAHTALREAAPSTRAEAVGYAQEVDELSAAMASMLDDAGVPGSDRVDATSLAIRFADLAAATSELSVAAEEGDPDRAERAVDEVRRLGRQINDAAADLGVPACGGF